jgi:hypothetical protein
MFQLVDTIMNIFLNKILYDYKSMIFIEKE